MAIDYRIDAGRLLAVIRITGTLSIAEIRSFADRLRSEPVFGPDLRQLVLLDIEASTVTPLEWIAQSERIGDRRGREIAVVAARDLAFGVARQYASVYKNEQQIIQVFRNLDAALEWLGVPPEVVTGV